MKSIIFASTLLGAAMAAPQGVTETLTPPGATPDGCSASFNGDFEITVAQITTQKRDLKRRGECGADGVLVMSLADGVTKDSKSRTGYIASNYQFQFDQPPQAGALYTAGFSVCDDGVMALGSNKTFFRCLSGDFYNLYDRNWAPQCEEVSILALPCGSDDSAAQLTDGQIIGTTVVQTTIVTALSDGQPQVITTQVSVPIISAYPTSAAVSQIGDGQIQVPPPSSMSGSTYVPSVSVPITSAGSSPGSATATATGVTLPTETGTTGATGATGTTGTSSATGTTAAATTKATTSAAGSSSATSPAASATTSAPSQGGSSRAAGSVGALVLGLVAAFVSL